MAASPDLIWHLVKNNNAFLVRRDRCAFSSEPGNLKNVHSARYSGLSQKRAVDVEVAADGKSAVLSIKSASSRRKPAREWNKIALKKDFRRSAKAIKAVTSSYRPDLTRTALARFSRLHWAAKSKAIAKKPITRKARRLASIKRVNAAARKLAAANRKRRSNKKTHRPTDATKTTKQ